MFKKSILAVFIFLGVFAFVFILRNSTSTSVDTLEKDSVLQDSNSAELEVSEVSQKITLNEFSKHNSREDCWIVYDGVIYDITSYLPRHPGGETAIAKSCGLTDFEARFTKKHGTSKVSLLMKVGTFIGDFDKVGALN